MVKRQQLYSLVIGYAQATISLSLWHDKKGIISQLNESLPQQLSDGTTESAHYDPLDIPYILRSLINTLLSHKKITSESIAEIGLVSEPGTCFIWDTQTGTPLTPILDLHDPIAIPTTKRFFFRKLGDPLLKHSGQVLRPTLSAFHWKAAIDRNWDLKSKIAKGSVRFGNISTWILHTISGGKQYLTDPSLASFTGLYNPYQNEWDSFLCSEFQIASSLLPGIQSSSSEFGVTSNFLPLSDNTPIRAMCSTALARLYGYGSHSPGDCLLILSPEGSFLFTS